MDELNALSLEDSTGDNSANPPSSDEIANDEQGPPNQHLGQAKIDDEEGKNFVNEADWNWSRKKRRIFTDEELFGEDKNLPFYNEAQWRIVDAPHLANGLPFSQTRIIYNPETRDYDKVTGEPYEPYRDKSQALWSLGQGYMHQYDDHQSVKRITWESKERCSFDPFQRLPLELRLKIWKLGLPDPQVVFLTLQMGCIDLFPKATNDRKSFMLACKESAFVFNENYGRLTAHKTCNGELVSTFTSNDYLDWKRDTLVFEIEYLRKERGDMASWQLFRPSDWGQYTYSLDLSKIENPAPSVITTYDKDPIKSMMDFVMTECPSLKSLTIVLNNFEHSNDDDEYPSDPEHLCDHAGTFHLLPIDGNLRYAEWDTREGHEAWDQSLHFEDVEPYVGQIQALQHHMKFASSTKKKFEKFLNAQPEKIQGLAGKDLENPARKVSKNNKFGVALLTWMAYDEGEAISLHWLQPVVKQPHSIVYYTTRPVVPPPDRWLQSNDLPYSLKCKANGSLIYRDPSADDPYEEWWAQDLTSEPNG